MNKVLLTTLFTLSFITTSFAGEFSCKCTKSSTVEYVKGETVIFGDKLATITTTLGTFNCIDKNANPMVAAMMGQMENEDLVNLIFCENQQDVTKGPGMLSLFDDNRLAYSVGDIDEVATFDCEEID